MKSRRVGLIVPLGEEFDYVSQLLPVTGSEKIDGAEYLHLAIPGAAVTGVARVLSDMGQAPATLTADRMISKLGVSVLVLVGLAGSLDDDVQLGDVVVADQIQEYMRGTKVTPGDAEGTFTFRRTVEGWRTNARLIDHARNLHWLPQSAPAMATWQAEAAARRPGSADKSKPAPKVHIGPVATGDVVVAASAFANWVRDGNRKLMAVEMEGGGAAFAAFQNDSADLLVVRGVSDFADEGKAALDAGKGADSKNEWRLHAIRNAIEYLIILLSSSGFPWRYADDAQLTRRQSGPIISRLATSVGAAASVLILTGEPDPPQEDPTDTETEDHADPYDEMTDDLTDADDFDSDASG
jgi:nucleoside phosphorylase